eukprot:gnl/MRDRNA2_/MRDRNA2_62819_c0_seq1.p1 gnl/MRDRNA2_/MRDRNA2_62819_c0~~gnl/MRDRNA2_/MRDRNA2_62819_c0_seq1.p1  ORF type:complete len:546 (+),score=70.52 gnl/MRDRNA2_/MRDRNA2_62819_c0_seq1:27-1664(+)
MVVTVKLVFLLFDHYSRNWFTVNGPICYVKPWAWLFAKWSVLPLRNAMDHETISHFQTFSERIDTEFCCKTYSIYLKMVRNITEMLLVATSSIFLGATEWALFGYAFTIFLVFGCQSDWVNRKFRLAHAAEWTAHEKFIAGRAMFFMEGSQQRNYNTVDRDVAIVMGNRRKRALARDTQWYKEHNQTEYIWWLMNSLIMALFLAAPFLVTAGRLTVGGFAVLVSQIGKASSNVVAYIKISLQEYAAQDCVKSFAKLLNSHTDDVTAVADHCTRLQRRQIYEERAQNMRQIHFCQVVMRDAIKQLDAELKVNGVINLGGIFGLPGDGKHAPFYVNLLQTIQGLNVPAQGVVVVPPWAKILSAPVAPQSLCMRRTVLENLQYGLVTPTRVSESQVWKLCKALGMNDRIFSPECGNVPLQQVLENMPQIDWTLISLVRALLCQPDILIVGCLSFPIPEKRRSMILNVLHKFVTGQSIRSLIASSQRKPQIAVVSAQSLSRANTLTDTSSAGMVERTVFWLASKESLNTMDKTIHVGPDGKLHVKVLSR